MAPAEIVGLLASGMTKGGIANHLVLSEHTVHRHVANILEAMDAVAEAQPVGAAALPMALTR
jgi:DNA-binding NarL/FixJ family response regulator